MPSPLRCTCISYQCCIFDFILNKIVLYKLKMFGFMVNVNFRKLLSRKKSVLWHYLHLNVLKNHNLKLGNTYRASVTVPFHAIMIWQNDELQGHSGWEEEERTPHYAIGQGSASLVKNASPWLCSEHRGEQADWFHWLYALLW